MPTRRRRTIPRALIGALLATAVTSQGAETLFVRGSVWTADPQRPFAEAVLVRDGRIAYVGETDDAVAAAGEDARRIDLQGRMLLPGFVESHTHPAMAGFLASQLQVIGTRTVADVQAALRSYAAAHPDAPVVFGFGFPSALNTQLNVAGVAGPHRADLDAVVADRPVLLIAVDAHSAWANSKALAMAGIDETTPDPLPGVHYYQRDKDGNPTGWLVESSAFWPLLPRFGVGTKEDFKIALGTMLPKLSAMGVTSLFDAGVPGGEAMLRNALAALAELEQEQRLPVRYRASVYVDNPKTKAEDAVRTVRAMRESFASDLVDVHTVKIANDGTIEGKTAATLAPYASGGDGAVLLSGEPLADVLATLRRANLDAHIHAIGDRTLRVVLDAAKIARQQVPQADAKVAVAHVMLAAPEDLRRLKALDVTIQTTPHWAHDLGGTLALYSRLLGNERGAGVMRLGDMLARAPLVAFGADYPATGLPQPQTSPLHGIEIGHTRRAPGDVDGKPLPPEGQTVPLAEMLRGYTANGAKQLRLDETGTIAHGKQADLVVLGADLFRIPPNRIHAVSVDMTMMGGRIVYERKPNERDAATARRPQPTSRQPTTHPNQLEMTSHGKSNIAS